MWKAFIGFFEKFVTVCACLTALLGVCVFAGYSTGLLTAEQALSLLPKRNYRKPVASVQQKLAPVELKEFVAVNKLPPVETFSIEDDRAAKQPMSYAEFKDRFMEILYQNKVFSRPPVQSPPFTFKFAPPRIFKPSVAPGDVPAPRPLKPKKDPSDRSIVELHR